MDESRVLKSRPGASATSLVLRNSRIRASVFRIGNWRFGLFMDNCVMKSWDDNEGSSLSEAAIREGLHGE